MELENIKHSLSHILASAVKSLYKDVKFGIGPAIENGFYYDMEIDLKDDDLKKIDLFPDPIKVIVNRVITEIENKEDEKFFLFTVPIVNRITITQ